jgi:hypothetical protein
MEQTECSEMLVDAGELPRRKHTTCFILLDKNTRISHWLYAHKTHRAFARSVNIINSVQRRQRQKETEIF